ncbi:MAG: triose-phosphate isomerase [Clostridia bacterium]|nr:triose-phosphate isomerase [Clostridia bacterium]
MNTALRKTVIAGNWKMNNTPSETKAMIAELRPLVADATCDVVLCVPYVDVFAAVEAAAGSNIKIGVENIHWAEKGAYTGEISAKMLAETGAEYVIVGHSERRQYFNETDKTVNLRTKAALAGGFKVILCVGETLDQRRSGYTFEVVRHQTAMALTGVSADELKNVIIAYEPVWAIGTGETATDEQANEVNCYIRKVLADLYCENCANATTIQYGGSMNAGNAAGLLAQPDVDGGLIGGASLKPVDFSVIVKAGSAE